MDDVVSVHGHRAFGVPFPLRLQVPLHQGNHLVLLHRTHLRVGQPPAAASLLSHEMVLTRQEASRTTSGRANRKARTRVALLQAATELVREGRQPSMPEAADRALISTAYRYFPSERERNSATSH